jgi:cell division protein FtsL
MKAFLFMLFTILLLASCTGKYALKKEIKQLEEQLSKDRNSSDSI